MAISPLNQLLEAQGGIVPLPVGMSVDKREEGIKQAKVKAYGRLVNLGLRYFPSPMYAMEDDGVSGSYRCLCGPFSQMRVIVIYIIPYSSRYPFSFSDHSSCSIWQDH